MQHAGSGTALASLDNDSVSRPQRIVINGEAFTVDDSAMGLLGHGGQGIVRVAVRDSDGASVAVKMAGQSVASSRELRAEVAALRRLDHPNVVRILAHVLATADTPEMVVLELCTGGELFDEVMMMTEARRCNSPGAKDAPHSGGLSHAQAAAYLRQLAGALAHCHALGVAHRDIKAENILLDEDGRLRLIDFGLAALVECDALQPAESFLARTQCGSLMYAAPELLRCPAEKERVRTHAPASNSEGAYVAYKVDVWSLGVVFYAMLTGSLPFKCAHAGMCTRYAEYASSKERTRVGHDLPAGARALLWRMLEPDPLRRASMAEVLAHPWLEEATAPAPVPGPAATAFEASALEMAARAMAKHAAEEACPGSFTTRPSSHVGTPALEAAPESATELHATPAGSLPMPPTHAHVAQHLMYKQMHPCPSPPRMKRFRDGDNGYASPRSRRFRGPAKSPTAEGPASSTAVPDDWHAALARRPSTTDSNTSFDAPMFGHDDPSAVGMLLLLAEPDQGNRLPA